MIPTIQNVTYVSNYNIHVRFADGVEADIDLTSELWGAVFEPLKDLAVFQAFRHDKELNTIVWPTGADLAPEFLYAQATQKNTPSTPKRRSA